MHQTIMESEGETMAALETSSWGQRRLGLLATTLSVFPCYLKPNNETSTFLLIDW